MKMLISLLSVIDCGILCKNTLCKSPKTQLEIPTLPTPSTTELITSISQLQAQELIQSWLKVRQDIFAPPYNQKLAAELTKGNVYDRISI